MNHSRKTSILIVGGGTGGVAAALAVARTGQRCIITEPTDWLGGQFTSQAVPADENRWIDDPAVPAATASYRAYRTAIRQWYRTHRHLTERAAADPALNPGNGWVSRLCCEPRVAHAVILETLAPHIASGHVAVLAAHEPIAADSTGDAVRSVTFRHLRSGDQTVIEADYVLDATETGDLLPLAGVDYLLGSEGRSQYGELHAPDAGSPLDQQAISWCFALEHIAGEDHTLSRPADYDRWRSLVPPGWPGPLFSWTLPDHDGRSTRELVMSPPPLPPRQWDLWTYRRIADASVYQPAPDGTPLEPDVCMVNWAQIDYYLKPVVDVSPESRAAALADARNQSRAFLYWLQTEAPHPKGAGFPGLRLRGDVLGTADGFAKAAYIREGRRMLARTVVHEGHVGLEQRRVEGHAGAGDPPWGLAHPFADSVGIGHYWIDLHVSAGGRKGLFIDAAPFRIPLGALIPRRTRNVLAAGKCLGVTHIANGCYRLHPIEWNVGEAAGLLAAYCLVGGIEPHAVHETLAHLGAFQKMLVREGIPLAWPWDARGLAV